MATALAGLGVTALSIDDSTRKRLDRDGYAPLPGVLSQRQLAVIRSRLAKLLASEADRAGLEVHQEAGTHRLVERVHLVYRLCGLDPVTGLMTTSAVFVWDPGPGCPETVNGGRHGRRPGWLAAALPRLARCAS